MCSTDGPSSNQPSQRRKLNPIFVEALMRWPTGLSGFERQEMAWTRWWLLMPSFLSALYSASAKANARTRDRGVKKAPFVVLIGAAMPSVLAEIGFVSNPRDEALFKKSDFRQKLAEGLESQEPADAPAK